MHVWSRTCISHHTHVQEDAFTEYLVENVQEELYEGHTCSGSEEYSVVETPRRNGAEPEIAATESAEAQRPVHPPYSVEALKDTVQKEKAVTFLQTALRNKLLRRNLPRLHAKNLGDRLVYEGMICRFCVGVFDSDECSIHNVFIMCV